MTTILMIDDDEDLCSVVAEFLAGFGLALEAAHTPTLGLDRLRRGGVALVLLDIMLPERDGFAVCRDIRAISLVPVIMLTARGDVIDRVVGLELGADDYLPKPFDPRELVARIRTVLRRRTMPAERMPADGLRLDAAARDAWLDGRRLDLTTMEFGLLALLAAAPQHTFSRDDIMDALRGIEADVFSRAVDVLVSRLRQKLGDAGKQPRFIKTVWGRGYAWLGDRHD